MASILVVEDDLEMRVMERIILERAGHRVIEAGHGLAGLDAVMADTPDLVVTDVRMPVMDGVEFIRHLRADPRTAPIPVLALSGDATLVLLADAVLTKPFTMRELLAAAAALLPGSVHPVAAA